MAGANGDGDDKARDEKKMELAGADLSGSSDHASEAEVEKSGEKSGPTPKVDPETNSIGDSEPIHDSSGDTLAVEQKTDIPVVGSEKDKDIVVSVGDSEVEAEGSGDNTEAKAEIESKDTAAEDVPGEPVGEGESERVGATGEVDDNAMNVGDETVAEEERSGGDAEGEPGHDSAEPLVEDITRASPLQEVAAGVDEPREETPDAIGEQASGDIEDKQDADTDATLSKTGGDIDANADVGAPAEGETYSPGDVQTSEQGASDEKHEPDTDGAEGDVQVGDEGIADPGNGADETTTKAADEQTIEEHQSDIEPERDGTREGTVRLVVDDLVAYPEESTGDIPVVAEVLAGAVDTTHEGDAEEEKAPPAESDEDDEVETADVPGDFGHREPQAVVVLGDEAEEEELIIDVLPNNDDVAVTNYQKQLKETLKLQQYIQTLMVIARYLYISEMALALDVNLLIKVQELLFTTLKLCDKTILMVQRFQSGANNILEKLKIAYLYCMDGFEDFARTDIEATKKDVASMGEGVSDTQEMLKKLAADIHEVEQELDAAIVRMRVEGASTPVTGRRDTLETYPEEGGAALATFPGSISRLTDSTDSFDDEHNKFKDVKGDKELLEARGQHKPSEVVERDELCCARYKLFLPPTVTKIVLFLTLLALATVVLHIVDEYYEIWKPIEGVYPAMFIASAICLGLLLLFLGIYNARKPFRSLQIMMLLSFVSIVLVFLQILARGLKLWSDAKNNWISFPVLVLLLVIESFGVMLLCAGGQPEYPHRIETINGVRRHEKQGSKPPGESSTDIEQPPMTSVQIVPRPPKETLPMKRLQEKYGRYQLSKVVLAESMTNLSLASGLLDALVPVVQGWLKECQDVIEPAMDQGIKQSASMGPEEKMKYWKSMAFKKEVTSYYCRWRALQVYCENTRPKFTSARQRIDRFYTENKVPGEAIKSAWVTAAEETAPEIRQIVEKYSPNHVI